jgi:hypothetical protein
MMLDSCHPGNRVKRRHQRIDLGGPQSPLGIDDGIAPRSDPWRWPQTNPSGADGRGVVSSRQARISLWLNPGKGKRARAYRSGISEFNYSGVFSVWSIGQETAKAIGGVAAIGNEATNWPDLLQQGPCVHLDLLWKRRAARR